MTPEERQLLNALADRVKNTAPQQRDAEADQVLRQLTEARPDTVYILAQTVLMQDFALRNAQAQIDDLKRQLEDQGPAGTRSGGSFLPGGFGSGGESRRTQGSVPPVNPWGSGPSQDRGYGDYPPPPQQGGYQGGYQQGGYVGPQGAPVMQPSQTSGFLRNAATTAAGVAGGALLFQGISSLFSGHHSGLMGSGFSSLNPTDSLSETTVVNNYYDDQTGSSSHTTNAAYDDGGSDGGVFDADYDQSDDDYGNGGDGGGDYA